MIKIAFLTSEYPHKITGTSGGIGTGIKNLASALVKQGNKVVVLVYGQSDESVFEDNGIIIHTIRNVRLKGMSWYLTRKKIEKIINELYKKGEIELLEAPDWTGITSFIKPKKCPIVIRLNGSDTYFCHIDNRPVKWVNKFHEKRAISKANGHISVSKYTADLTNELFKQQVCYEVIPNGINLNAFLSEKEILNKDILYFGTLIRKKGVLELPLIFNKVVEAIPKARLILVGGDSFDIRTGNSSTWELMKSQFSEVALGSVLYIGKVPYEDVRRYIMSARVCVFPSYAEALPLSWLEAMAMGKPIVASNIGWATEMIENDKEGFLRAPGNHQQYAEAIIDLLENSERANKFGVSAKKKVEKSFCTDLVAQMNMDFYQKIIALK